MKFIYGKQDMRTLDQAQENCILMTNGLGGYCSVSTGFSVTRGDQGILIAAVTAPNERCTLVHRLREQLNWQDGTAFLSTQCFRGNNAPEDGFHYLTSFACDDSPQWYYEIGGVTVAREMGMAYGENRTAVRYRVSNATLSECTLNVSPRFVCKPKGDVRRRKASAQWDGKKLSCGRCHVYVSADVPLQETSMQWETLFYPDDAKDGRKKHGMAFGCMEAALTVLPGETKEMVLLFSAEAEPASGVQVLRDYRSRQRNLEQQAPFRDPTAKLLARSADAFITRRASTDGKTIVAGYPFFGDWGRDTMIALPGCVLATGQKETAVSILRTFLAYERGGLVPNLFPEGSQMPMYNTVDAALLLINCIWLYYEKYKDDAFIREAYPVMKRIVSAYRRGTAHGIRMDSDGLIQAGEGLDQVTWMDVCINGILPTPRHGKPVEVNAYWYNALRIMEQLAPLVGDDSDFFSSLAHTVRTSFTEKFWVEEQGYLRDVLSGTHADDQLRCNQIWAVSMPFTMLRPEQEAKIVETVFRKLYTPCGLRTLSPDDPEFHPNYGGSQLQRDLAYHQGTVWVFPLGAYYRAYLKIHKFSREAAAAVRRRLSGMESMLREGCVGQLPEIYDGGIPTVSKGCFAQAWSVGEMLTVYALLEKIEQEES